MIKAQYIDIQFNGYMGVDFSQPNLTMQKIKEVTSALVEKGTIAYCPTVCTTEMSTYERNLTMLADAIDDPQLSSNILGIHMEGPFISPVSGAVGAHPPKCVLEPSIDVYKQFQKWARGKIKILTLAPERPNAIELIKAVTDDGVKVFIGHHLADAQTIAKAVEAGAIGSTHLGNGLPQLIDRHNNPLWPQIANDNLWASIITDGHHLPPDLIKTIIKAKGIDKVIVTSDASPMAGLPPGIYPAFGKEVEILENHKIEVVGIGCLAGSHSTMQECVQFLESLNFLTEAEIEQVSYHNQFRMLGL